MEAYSKIKIMDLDTDEDFQIMDDVFSIEEDEEITLVLEEKTLYCLENNLVEEELLSIPKLVFVNKKNIQRVVTAVESKETKVAGRSKKRNSDDLSSYYECEKSNKKYKSDVFFKKTRHQMQGLTYLFQVLS